MRRVLPGGDGVAAERHRRGIARRDRERAQGRGVIGRFLNGLQRRQDHGGITRLVDLRDLGAALRHDRAAIRANAIVLIARRLLLIRRRGAAAAAAEANAGIGAVIGRAGNVDPHSTTFRQAYSTVPYPSARAFSASARRLVWKRTRRHPMLLAMRSTCAEQWCMRSTAGWLPTAATMTKHGSPLSSSRRHSKVPTRSKPR